MKRSRWRRWAVLLFVCWGSLAVAQDTGRLEGEVSKNGEGVAGVVVILNELKRTEVTDEQGLFAFGKVPVGSYTLILSLGDNTKTLPNTVVSAGTTMRVEVPVDWNLGASERVVVTAAARAAKIVDAPAAVTEIPEEQIKRSASTGQVPKVLEFTPGAEITQSGLYDFNFNTRGFNSSLNRRVSTYIDGRDVGVVLLGAQEWAAISGGLDDVANLEFIRGPSAALYGANASSGVVNITTKAPRDTMGTFVRLTGGELDTQNIDFRWAGALGEDWYVKATGGSKNSGDFTDSRNPEVISQPEYSNFCFQTGDKFCLLGERSLFREQNNDIRYGSVRIDKYVGDQSLYTFETGLSDIEGPVFLTGIGRVQILSSKRPFYRFNYSNRHWNVLAHYAEREGQQANLTEALKSNFGLLTDTKRYGVEAQGNWNFFADRLRFVVGAAYTEEEVDTWNPVTERQTVVYEPIETDRQAIFTQLDWRISDRWKLVGAGRIDWNTLHDTQVSPKAAVVYSINPKNSFRLTFNKAFQVANYSEFFLHTPIASFPIGGFSEVLCSSPALPQPVDCGIDEDFIPILAVGNDDLKLEKTEAFELGYSGLFANKVFVTVDYYNSENKNFITDLIPQVGTIPGELDGCLNSKLEPETDPLKCPVNPDYLTWVSTEEAETTILFSDITVAEAVRNAVEGSVGGDTLGFRLAEDLDGSLVVVGRTYTNVGLVDTQGVDFGLQYFINNAWSLQASYSWFDFDIQDEDPEVREILLPNSPEHKASMAINFTKERWHAGIAGRWVHGFIWSAGVFHGRVPDYSTVDLSGSYQINDVLRLGINVANVRDTEHYQAFGGDLIERRALVHLTAEW